MIMKKLSKISLHKLSGAMLAEKEQKMIVGGKCACIGVCWGDSCRCTEDGSGYFPLSNNNVAASSGIDSENQTSNNADRNSA